MLWQQFQIALNTNHAWLLIVAERLLQGGRYVSDFYEPNPPMSLIIYIPQYWLHTLLGIPLQFTPALFGLIYILMAAGCLLYLLKKTNVFTDNRLSSILFIAFLLAGIFMPGNIYFSERDHYVFLTLVPVLLAQIAITNGHRFHPAYARAGFFFGGLLLLIKPHYGLFPAIVFVHRLYKNKAIMPVFRSPDFQGLAASVICYALILLTIFPEYPDKIFQDFLTIYLGDLSKNIFPYFFYYASFCLFVVAGAYFLPIPKDHHEAINALVLASLIAFFLYYLQGKNFTYHTIAGLSFLYMALVVLTWSLIQTFVFRNKQACTAACVTLVIALTGAYTIRPPLQDFPTHSEYMTTPLSKEIEQCESPCPHFIFSENMEIIFQIAVYSGEQHASRYPGLWWLDYAVKHAEDEALRQKHLHYMAEDFERYAPKRLIIATNMTRGGIKNFDLMAYMKQNVELEKILSRYDYDHTLKDNRRYYFTGTNFDTDFPILYDVYTLNRPE